MKKIIALAAAAVLLLAGASKLNAQDDVYYYGFITTCGEVEYMDMPYEMSDDECVFWMDFYEWIDCEFDYGW